MPADPNTIAAVSDGVNQIANTISVADTTKKQRKWAEAQYEKQRAHNLSDWNMQNAYNTPAAQMQRLKDAGLNPNLVYGNGADATSAAGPRSADTPAWDAKAPQFNFSAQNSLSNYYDTQIKQATVDNLAVQNTVLTQDAILRAAQVQQTAAQTAQTATSTAEGQTRLRYADELAKISVDAAKANVNQTMSSTTFTQNSDKRAENMNQSQMSQIAQNILTQKFTNLQTQQMNAATRGKMEQDIRESKERIKNMEKSGQLQQLEIEMKNKGIMPQDPWYLRILNRVWEGATPSAALEEYENRKTAKPQQWAPSR